MSPASQPIFRFAPSPNGQMHLGNAYSALYTDHWARMLGGAALLRIEDIDTARAREEHVAAMIADLAWLGLRYPQPVRRQSRHFSDYAAGAARLREMGLLYPCFCTRGEIRAASDGQTDPEGAPLYPGTCRVLFPAEREAKLAQGVPVQWRLDMRRALGRSEGLTITEAMPDPDCAPRIRHADPGRWGDVVIVRKDTPTSYHLSVVIDDALQGVSHVTRGMDLHEATDIHVLLQALLGFASPLYTHHRLIRDEDDLKLSKSRGSETLADLRAAGWTPDAVRTHLGF